jgi:hypothetical protein
MPHCPPQNITDDQQAQLALMRLAENLDEIFNGDNHTAPPQTGFMLLVAYPMAGEDRCSVVSNMSQRDMLAMLKLQVARLEGQAFQTGHA